MATSLRRATSLPARPELTAAPVAGQNLSELDVETKVATSPSRLEPRSPPAVATFSPLFDLELGGSCAPTPFTAALPRARGPSGHGAPQRSATAAGLGLQRPPPAAEAATSEAAAAARCKLPGATSLQKLQHKAAVDGPLAAGAIAGSGLDRSVSDLQVLWGRRNAGGNCNVSLYSSDLMTPSGDRLMELCKPSSELALQLSRRLRAFRAARIAELPRSALSAADRTPTAALGAAPATTGAAATPSSTTAFAVAAAVPPPLRPTPGEIELLASELASDGFRVQILDGTRLSRDARSCLRTLKHRFLVCLGQVVPPRRRSAQGSEAPAAAAAGVAAAAGPSEPPLDPLVVELRFREQFLIASPTRDYERLLLALPVVFVGPLRQLDAIVDLMAGEVAAVFRAAKRSLPPWRTKGAMLSKWAPAQLSELERLIAVMQQQQDQQQHQREKEREKERADCDRSWGSAVGHAAASTTQAEPLPEPLSAAARAPSAARPCLGRATADGATGAVTAAAAAAADGELTDEEVVPRSNSAPPRAAAGPRGAAATAAATGGGVDGATADLMAAEVGISPGRRMRQSCARIGQGEPPGAAAVAASGCAAGVGAGADAADRYGATRVAAAVPGSLTLGRDVGGGGGGLRSHVEELSFPSLPEVVPLADAGRALAQAGGPMGHSVAQWQEQREHHHQQQQQQEEGTSPPPPPPPAAAATGQVDGEVATAMAEPPPPMPPTFRPGRDLSVLSPFARISLPLPEQYEHEYGDQDGGDGDDDGDASRGRPWSMHLPTIGVGVGGGSSRDVLPELTFKHHTALMDCHGTDGAVMELGCCDAPAGGAGHHYPTLPLPTPPRPAGLVGGGGAAAPAAPAGGAAAPAGFNPAHQPLASGALGLYDTGGDGGLDPSAPHPSPKLNDGPLQFPVWADTLLITRSSSSDLRKAAEKFKKATSLLATALRRAKGSGGGGGAAAAAAAAVAGTNPDNNHQQQQQQEQEQHERDGPVRDARVTLASGVGGGGGSGRANAAAEAVGGGAAVTETLVRAGGATTTTTTAGGGGGGGQVALPGGVMTQPSTDEPVWARIRTVKWTQPAAAAGAGARGRGGSPA
ncbi:hypothetical protein PLESTB_000270400 [Pleodorina starrii]|uniref:Uncharacterized protein n=1 Tax=Pleodorina starrii TaxID=330485 RepID=A0A9W6BDN8_9CHLO|nr:hypothetical protein PLESTB_000270400 [Pleodorina starrii]